MTEGAFILVVGPSGAGKDSLIAGAAEALKNDTRFLFPKRQVTRASQPDAEVHDTLSRAEFDHCIKNHDYTLAWEAHGLGYILPAAIGEAVRNGQNVVCNVSRTVIAEAQEKFAGTHVFYIDARPEILGRRLAGRGRETAEEIEERLAQKPISLPKNVPLTRIDNSGKLEAGIAAFVTALVSLATHSLNDEISR